MIFQNAQLQIGMSSRDMWNLILIRCVQTYFASLYVIWKLSSLFSLVPMHGDQWKLRGQFDQYMKGDTERHTLLENNYEITKPYSFHVSLVDL